MRFVVAALFVTACFQPSPPANVPCGSGDQPCPSGQRCIGGTCYRDDEIPVDAAIDGNTSCPIGDNVCLVSCLFYDTDCSTTCGDGRCVGNAGEMCGTCPADCATQDNTCGNGECEPGESPDCFADCGPVPWPFGTDEAQLLALINNVRTTGHQCPNDTMAATRPALATDNSMQTIGREWAWEIAHEQVFIAGGGACNGRTLAQREAAGGNFTQFIQARGGASTQVVFDNWLANAQICPIIMTTLTKVSVAAAVDKTRGYVVLLK